MNKIYLLLLSLTLSCGVVYAQHTGIDELVEKGNQLYDNGKYIEAIGLYQEALALDSTASRPNYEMANTYLALEKYEKALWYIEKVIQKNDKYMDQAYTLKGTAFDMMGQFEAAVQAYTDGVKQFPHDYLLNYNLALTYYNAKDYTDAEHYATAALQANIHHPSSNLILAKCMYHDGKKAQSLLCLYYFLLLEPNSKRAAGAMELMDKLFNEGVRKDSANHITITISGIDGDYGAANLAVSAMRAVKDEEKNKDKSEEQMFYENTESFFKIMGELKNNTKTKDIWWDIYTPFFYSLVNAGQTETYCYYISSSRNKETISSWLKNNKDKVEQLMNWCNNYYK